jgi:H+/Cl- antiporter ClcA
MLKRELPRTKTEYVYRRRLEPSELLPAIGVGIGVGAFAFYVAYLFLQRTPLEPRRVESSSPAKRLLRGAAD